MSTLEQREPIVQLQEDEMLAGTIIGSMRSIRAILYGRRNRADGIDDDGRIWTRNVEGALAEVAAQRALGVNWSGLEGGAGTKALGGDAGPYQIRLRIADYLDERPRMIVQQQDAPHEAFVLVVGRLGLYRLVGWMHAGEARQHGEWIANPGGWGEAWFVPQAALRPIAALAAEHDLTGATA